MKSKTFIPLFAEADRAKVKPILDALAARGCTVTETKKTAKNRTLLLFLSEAFAAEQPLHEEFFRLSHDRPSVIPINLDGSTPPELIKSALFARNTIDASRYSTDELAERIVGATEPQKKKKTLPLVIGLVAVLLIIGAILYAVLRSKPNEEEPEAEPTSAPTAVPTAAPEPIYIPPESGLKPEDLENVFELVIVGNQLRAYTGQEDDGFQGAMRGSDALGNVDEDENGEVHWYYLDLNEVHPYRWESLDFIRYMKKLKLMTLVEVDGVLPDLSGLERLDNVIILESAIDSIEGLRGSTIMHFEYRGGAVKDFSPLNDCKKLTQLHISFFGAEGDVDLSNLKLEKLIELDLANGYALTSLNLDGFQTGKELQRLTVNQGVPIADLSFMSEATGLQEVRLELLPSLTALTGLEEHRALNTLTVSGCENLGDLTALKTCSRLENVNLNDVKMRDLSFMKDGLLGLRQFEMGGNPELRTLSGIEDHHDLTELTMGGVDRLTDLSALGSCTNLQVLNIRGAWDLRDMSVISKLKKLRNLELYGHSIRDVDFLWNVTMNSSFSFGISAVIDWSGLAAIKSYDFLNLSFDWYSQNDPFDFLQDKTIKRLELRDRTGEGTGFDMTKLPNVTGYLYIEDVGSLSGMPALTLTEVEIDSDWLTSLDGLQNLKLFGKSRGYLELYNCPRLSDWSALEGMSLASVRFHDTYTLPDFSTFTATSIMLGNIAGLTDLHCFDGLSAKGRYYITLNQMDEVTDLEPLYRLNGPYLEVPQHLAAQAYELQARGNFSEIRIYEPDWWEEQEELSVKLRSLDELDTLPEAALAHVTELYLLGDTLYDPEQWWVEEDWSTNPRTLYLHRNDRDERIQAQMGTWTDLGKLSKLTGLKIVQIRYQSLTALDGIQNCPDLFWLDVRDCPNLTDASAAFTMQGLKGLLLNDTDIDSIEGVELLPELEQLEFRNTRVTSIAGVEQLRSLRVLDLNDCPVDDLTPIESLPTEASVSFSPPMMTTDEFLALPDSLLCHVSWIAIAGNMVYDGSEWWVEEELNTDPHTLYLHRNDSDERVPIGPGTLTDLSFLERMPNMRDLHIWALDVTSLDGVESCPNLESLYVDASPTLVDASAAFALPRLRELILNGTSTASIAGVENLRELEKLELSGTHVTSIAGVEQLERLYYLNISGCPIADYSPLDALPEHVYVNVGLSNMTVQELKSMPDALLRSVRRLGLLGDLVYNPQEYWVWEDWSTNPPSLFLVPNGGNENDRIAPLPGTLTDLSFLSRMPKLNDLHINLQPITSLDGVQNCQNLGWIDARQCPNLSDASAAFSLPELGGLLLRYTDLASIAGIENARALEHLEFENTRVDSLAGVEQLPNLRQLECRGCPITDYSVLDLLPENAEVHFDLPVMTLDEFLALPDSMLRKVMEIGVAGDTVFPWNEYRFEDEWNQNGVAGWIRKNDSDERIKVPWGAKTDLTFLPDLPNLEQLGVYASPLTSLDGVERFEKLRTLEIGRSEAPYTDVGKAFALPVIEELRFANVRGVTSIEGIEQVKRLHNLNLCGTKVKDLTPLLGVDFTEPWRQDWYLYLSLDYLNEADASTFMVLNQLGMRYDLNVNGNDARLWADALDGTYLVRLWACDVRLTDEQFRHICETHPELEQIGIPGETGVTDLTPLLSLPNLRFVRVTRNMDRALRSIEGASYGFDLEIN